MGGYALRASINRTLHRAYIRGIALQSNYARQFSAEVAALASLGLITTKEAPHVFGKVWRPTAEGLQLLCEEGYL